MFDNVQVNSNSQSVTFNSVAGTLIKSTENSKFVRFDMESNLAVWMFDTDCPHRKKQPEYPYKKTEVIILQVMLCGDNQFLVEYLDKEVNDVSKRTIP